MARVRGDRKTLQSREDGRPALRQGKEKTLTAEADQDCCRVKSPGNLAMVTAIVLASSLFMRYRVWLASDAK